MQETQEPENIELDITDTSDYRSAPAGGPVLTDCVVAEGGG